MTPEATRADSVDGAVFRVVRCDAPEGWGATIQRTPQGGARIPATLARPGVLEYEGDDGKPVREWRPSSEVLDPEALKQLENAPVTSEHPAEGLVTPDNYEQVSKGHVAAGSVRVENGLPVADLVIGSKGLLQDIGSGKRTQISLGYTTRLDNTPGVVPDGEPDAGQSYDRKQVGPTKNNHVAVTERGRAGSVASLRLDSAGNCCSTERASSKEELSSMEPIVIDGTTYPRGTPAEIAAAFAAIARLDATRVRNDAIASKAIEAREAELASKEKALMADLAAREEKHTEVVKRFDAAMDDKVNAKVMLLLAVKKALGDDYDATGKTDDDLMKAVVAKAFPGVNLEGKSPEALTALMEAAAGTPEVTATQDADDVAPEPDADDAVPTMDGDAPLDGMRPKLPGEQRADSRTSLAHLQGARFGGGSRQPAAPRVDPRVAMIEKDRARGTAPLPSAR